MAEWRSMVKLTGIGQFRIETMENSNFIFSQVFELLEKGVDLTTNFKY